MKEHDQTPAVVGGVRKPGDEAPARKRREITEADCTTDKAVIGTKETMRPAQVTVNGHVVANQLQFVNHQLRTELESWLFATTIYISLMNSDISKVSCTASSAVRDCGFRR